MRNFPNQVTDFRRLRDTLRAIVDLSVRGEDVLDDGVLGYELARRRIYTFRYLDSSNASDQAVDARIAEERKKAVGSQGARTYARELRRTLGHLSWITQEGLPTDAGLELLASRAEGETERQLLRQGLIGLALGDTAESTSHPLMMLLRLLAERTSERRFGLELAFENVNDGPAEVHRVLHIYNTARDDEDIRAATGVSESQQKNSRKVLPTLAKYANLVVEKDRRWSLTAFGAQVISAESPDSLEPSVVVPPTGSRSVTIGRRKEHSDVAAHGMDRAIPQALTPEQQQAAQQRLNERTVAHQLLVRAVARIIGERGKIWEDQHSFDLLWLPDNADVVYLFEMKTINGDADAQVIRAVGQLVYYRHFNVSALCGDIEVRLTVVVDAPLHNDLCSFLDKLGIGLISLPDDDGTPTAQNRRGQTVLAVLLGQDA